MELVIDGLTAEQTLDAVESRHRAQQQAEVETFVMAAHYAALHNADSLAGERRLPGRERAVQLGGTGTPRVAEFRVVEFGARKQWGPVAARFYFSDVLDCQFRLPRIWARVVAGQARVSLARDVARATHDLSIEAAARVDAAMCRCVDGRLPKSRFSAKLVGQVTAADPGRAARQEAKEAERRYARAGRSTEHGMRGFFLRSTFAEVTRFEATVSFFAAALKALGDTEGEDARRCKACLIMANPLQGVELMAAFAAHQATHPATGAPEEPEAEDQAAGDSEPAEEDLAPCPTCGRTEAVETTGDPTVFLEPRPFRPGSLGTQLARLSALLNGGPDADPTTGPAGAGAPAGPAGPAPFVFEWAKLMPKAVLYVHTSRAGLEDSDGYAVRVEDAGALTTDWLRNRLGPHVRFVIRPVIDLAHQVPVDAYEIPHRHREAVVLRTPAEVFPFSTAPARGAQIDHTDPYQPMGAGGRPGQSRLENYGPLSRFTHRIKTFGRWAVRQPFNGIFIWRDPYGHYYLVDNTGTRKLTAPPGREGWEGGQHDDQHHSEHGD